MKELSYKEFIDKYGQVKVKFSSYYKYSFSFSNEEMNLSVSVGGNHDDIYRMEVEADKEYTISELEPSSASMNSEYILWDLF